MSWIDYGTVEKLIYEKAKNANLKASAKYMLQDGFQPTVSPTLVDDFLYSHPEPTAPIEPPPWHIAAQWVYWHRRMPKYRLERKIWREAHTKTLAAPVHQKSHWKYEGESNGLTYTSGPTYWEPTKPLNVYGDAIVTDSLPITFEGTWTQV